MGRDAGLGLGAGHRSRSRHNASILRVSPSEKKEECFSFLSFSFLLPDRDRRHCIPSTPAKPGRELPPPPPPPPPPPGKLPPSLPLSCLTYSVTSFDNFYLLHSSAHISERPRPVQHMKKMRGARGGTGFSRRKCIDLHVSAIARNTTSPSRIEAELPGICGLDGCQLARMSMR